MTEASQIEIIKRFYAALNSYDVPALLALCDPDIVRTEFEGSASGGTYHGLAGLEKNVHDGRSNWIEGGCNPEQFITAGNKVVVLVHVHVRVKDKADWIDGRVADTFAFRNGKLSEFRSYFKTEDALAWAGA